MTHRHAHIFKVLVSVFYSRRTNRYTPTSSFLHHLLKPNIIKIINVFSIMYYNQQ